MRSNTAEAAPVEERVLRQYFSEVARHRVLSVEEERALGRRFRGGDPDAGRTLVESNLRFAIKVAKAYRAPGMSMPDLVQEASLGLIHAVERFDPERGSRLISFAVWWIRAQLQSYVLRSWSLVKLGTTQAQRRVFFGLSRAVRRLDAHSTDREQNTLQLSRALGVEPAELEATRLRMAARDTSLEAPVHPESDATAGDELAGADPLPDELVAQAEWEHSIQRAVHHALGSLDPRERFIAERRLLEDDPPTLATLAAQFGFSRERARQLELRAKAKLRIALAPLVADRCAA
jgi:RNA polymerase sigma-32 factor